MKENIDKIFKKLEGIEKEFSYRELETAFYIYARYGVDEYTEEQIKEVDEILIRHNGSLFPDDVNYDTENIVGEDSVMSNEEYEEYKNLDELPF